MYKPKYKKIEAKSHKEIAQTDRNIEYEISLGEEKWGDSKVPVYKVRILNDGKAKGRLVPSFPDTQQGRKELREVCQTLLEFLEEDK